MHETYLRLVDQDRVDWRSRAHFLAIAAKMMRRVLVDESQFRHRAAVALFHMPPQRVLAPFAASYAVSADGDGFLTRPEAPAGTYRTVSVVTNVLARRE